LEHLHELINGIKPKRPAGTFRIFLQEKAKKYELKDLQDGKQKWNELKEEEKGEYLKKSHTLSLAYKYKKMIFEKKIRKIRPKKPPSSLGFFMKEKKG